MIFFLFFSQLWNWNLCLVYLIATYVNLEFLKTLYKYKIIVYYFFYNMCVPHMHSASKL